MRRRTDRLRPAKFAVPTRAIETETHGEPRLPVIITLVVAIAIPLLQPDELTPGSRWIVPSIIFVLMVAMLVLDPGRIDRRSVQLHWLRLGIRCESWDFIAARPLTVVAVPEFGDCSTAATTREHSSGRKCKIASISPIRSRAVEGSPRAKHV